VKIIAPKFGTFRINPYLCSRITREEVRAAFRETMRRKKERMEENLKRMEELELQGFFA